MGSLREIKDRIGSVKSTLKITSAMKLVASSKLRKSQRAIESMLPYKEALEDILSCISGSLPAEESSPENKGKVAIVAIASNSSLCGGFNVNAVRSALQEASKYEEVEIVAVGRKMADAARKAGFTQEKDWSGLVARPSYESSASLADYLQERFESGAYSKVVLVYNHFLSTSRQEPVVEQFLPWSAGLSDAPVDAGRDEYYADTYIFEPGASAISDELRPKVRKLKIYTAILDSSAAEHAARTIAMQTASDNAEDILSELTLEYNKGRQQKITAEILDLVGGSLQ